MPTAGAQIKAMEEVGEQVRALPSKFRRFGIESQLGASSLRTGLQMSSLRLL